MSQRGRAGPRGPDCCPPLPVAKVFGKRLGHHLSGTLRTGLCPWLGSLKVLRVRVSGCELCPRYWEVSLPRDMQCLPSPEPWWPVGNGPQLKGQAFSLISQTLGEAEVGPGCGRLGWTQRPGSA